MPIWLAFVDLIRSLLLSLAHTAGGSVGSAIFALSVIVRVIVLPLTIKAALRARESAERLRALEPELKRLRERHAKDPQRLWTETRALHQQHNIQAMPKIALLNMAVQAPLGMAVYRVIVENAARAGRFLWMADLARPDVFITGIAAAAASLAVLLAPGGPGVNNKVNAVIIGVVTVAITWRLVAGVGLYWVGSSAVGVAQSLILRRVTKRPR
ncbi:MAG: YidC/Oxa1 family membrane protein insertase [Gemmatimonadaceae bacterium]